MKNYLKFIYFYFKNLILLYGILILSIIFFSAISEDFANLVSMININFITFNKLLNLSKSLLLSLSIVSLVITNIEFFWKKENKKREVLTIE